LKSIKTNNSDIAVTHFLGNLFVQQLEWVCQERHKTDRQTKIGIISSVMYIEI